MWYQNNAFTWINNKKEVCKVNKGFKTEILCHKYEWHSSNNRQPLMVIGQLETIWKNHYFKQILIKNVVLFFKR